jgi:DNA-binding MarR family transcriptional regulator
MMSDIDSIQASEPLEAIPALQLDRQFCFVLYALSRRITQLYRPLLEPLGLTYPQYLAMLVLWETASSGEGHRGVPVKYLCERLMLDTGTLTPLLKRLETQGMLRRKRSTSDEREVRVSLTEAGLGLRASAQTVPGAMLEKSGLTVEEILPLFQGLKQLLTKTDAGE